MTSLSEFILTVNLTNEFGEPILLRLAGDPDLNAELLAMADAVVEALTALSTLQRRVGRLQNE